jgi:hypothetical protein
LVQGMCHDRNRKPYELKFCDKECDWHTVQDEVGPTRWGPFKTNQTCPVLPLLWLALFPILFSPSAFFGLVTGFSQAPA